MEETNFKVDNEYSNYTTKLDDIRKEFLNKENGTFINANKYHEHDNNIFYDIENVNSTKDLLERDKDVFNIENKKINIYNEKTDLLDDENDCSFNKNICSINNKDIKNFSNDLKKNEKFTIRHAYIDTDENTNRYNDFYQLKISDYPNRDNLENFYIQRDELSISAGSIAKIEEVSEKDDSGFFRSIFGRRN